MNFRLSVLLLACASAEAQHTQKAHDHGAAQLNIAVDGKTAVIEFESPAQSIIGFEHAARTADQKKKQESAFNVFRTQFGMLVVLDPKLGCGFSARKVALEKDDDEPAPPPAAKGIKAAEHSDVKAEIAVSCAKPLGGTKVHFGFAKAFPGVQVLNVQALSGSGQSGAQIKNDQGEITLGQ